MLGYKVELEAFEGPLDLLLHLIRKNDVEITNIPIALILDQYWDYLNLMDELNIDLAGDFLLMASELAHIKSRMLLPKPEPELEPEEDPRAQLMQRLLEYQRYREVSERLWQLPQLDRDVFKRRAKVEVAALPRLSCEIHALLQSYHALISRVDAPPLEPLAREHLKVTDRMYELLEILRSKPYVAFFSLCRDAAARELLVVTFLAILEMARLKWLGLTQAEPGAEIYLRPRELEEEAIA